MDDSNVFRVSSFFGFTLSILFLGGLFFVALVNRSLGLISVAGTTFLVMAGLNLWTRLAPLKLSLHLHLDHRRLFPGEVAHLEMVIHNAKLLPFYLSLEGPFSLMGQTIISPFSRLHHTWNLHFDKRGVYPLEKYTLTFGDPFGISQTSKILPLQEEIIVYPKLKRIDDSMVRFQEFFGLHPAKGLVEDPAWYAGTRDYTGSRPARFIHWKVSARIGKVQEKLFEPTSHAKILILVKVEGFSQSLSQLGSSDPSMDQITRKNLELAFETLLEAVASYAYLASQQGASLAFVTDGELVGDPEPFLSMGSGYDHLGRFLEKLARLRFPPPYPGSKTSSVPSDEYYRMAIELGRWGTGYIYACYERMEGETAKQILSPHRRDRVLILTPSDTGEEKDG